MKSIKSYLESLRSLQNGFRLTRLGYSTLRPPVALPFGQTRCRKPCRRPLLGRTKKHCGMSQEGLFRPTPSGPQNSAAST